MEAQVQNAKQQAILTALKAQVTSDEAHIHLDIHSLRYLYSLIYIVVAVIINCSSITQFIM